MASPNPFPLVYGKNVALVADLQTAGYDGVVLVTYPGDITRTTPSSLLKAVTDAISYDKALETEVGLISCVDVAGSRLIVSPTPANVFYDDVRCVVEAAKAGISRAIKAGVRSPILVTSNKQEHFPSEVLCQLLGALHALHVPLQVRDTGKLVKCQKLGVYGDCSEELLRLALRLEEARGVARDIGGGDPERMAPPRVEEYVRNVFQHAPNITLRVQEDVALLEKEYPLFAAVNRAANEIPRHRGRVIFLEYVPENLKEVKQTVMLVGKGVTYDTGGADIKAGGIMAGMSRDKCGAAAVAGFIKACQLLKPRHLKVIGVMCMVRNSVGENSYVADELITARSGARVRVGNTDAEGRMIMADLLCLMKERAATEVNCHIYSVATLTGHAIRACGEDYGIILDNPTARAKGHCHMLQECGEQLGDMLEISRLRREDLKAHRGTFEGDDALQAMNEASVQTDRGHQKPAGFLLIASGLEKEESLSYTHLDIAGSAGIAPAEPSGAPVLALASLYKLF